MKKLMFFLGAVILCLAVGCSRENGPVPEIELASSQKDLIEVGPYDTSFVVRFSSALEWHVELQEGADWIDVSPMEGQPGMARLTVQAGANPVEEARTAVINITSGDLKVPVTVKQEAFIPVFDISETEVEVSAAGATFSVTVTSDLTYECKVDAGWIRKVTSRGLETEKHFFEADANPQAEPRSAVISFVSGDIVRSVNVVQRAAGTEADDWKKDSFLQRSLAMRFTADWCGYCPYMAKAFDEAEQSMDGRFVTVSLHGGQSALEFSSISSFLNRFNVAGFPTGIVDARANVPNYNNTSTTASVAKAVAEETHENYPSQTGIAVNSTLDGTSLTVDLTLYVKKADTYRVTVILLEDGIIGYQNGAVASSRYEHNDIARQAVTSASGETVKIDADYTVWEKTFTSTISSAYNPENLRLLVYVEKPYGGREKVQGVDGAEYGNYGDTYIDNCRAVVVGENAPLELN